MEHAIVLDGTCKSIGKDTPEIHKSPIKHTSDDGFLSPFKKRRGKYEHSEFGAE